MCLAEVCKSVKYSPHPTSPQKTLILVRSQRACWGTSDDNIQKLAERRSVNFQSWKVFIWITIMQPSEPTRTQRVVRETPPPPHPFSSPLFSQRSGTPLVLVMQLAFILSSKIHFSARNVFRNKSCFQMQMTLLPNNNNHFSVSLREDYKTWLILADNLRWWIRRYKQNYHDFFFFPNADFLRHRFSPIAHYCLFAGGSKVPHSDHVPISSCVSSHWPHYSSQVRNYKWARCFLERVISAPATSEPDDAPLAFTSRRKSPLVHLLSH